MCVCVRVCVCVPITGSPILFSLQTHPVPMAWGYQDARKLFLLAPQTEAPGLAWTEPDEEVLVQFLCHRKHIK